jgi:Mannosyltransferase (PIG-V)
MLVGAVLEPQTDVARQLHTARASAARWREKWSKMAVAASSAWLLPFVVAPYLLTRIAILLVGEVAAISIDRLAEHGPVAPPYATSWLGPLLQYDAQWYINIASRWYEFDPTAQGGQTSVVFFPLYPALMRVVTTVFAFGNPDALPVTGLVVANVAGLVGLALLFKLAVREFGASVAQRTIWYLLIFPASIYLSSAYAEPLFLTATVGAMYAARTRHWYLAGLAGAAAALSRPYGVLISIPLVVEYLRQNWGAPRDMLRLHTVALLLPSVALLGWLGYLYNLTGDPLVFVHAQAAWNQQHLTSPLETLVTGYRRTRDQQLSGRLDLGGLQFAISALGAVATLLAFRWLPLSYGAFAAVFLLVILGSGSTMSIWRHIYLIFPLFMLAARAGASSVFDRAYVSFSLMLGGLFVTLLVTYWAIVS